MQVRLLEYFVALAREQHFARAARMCSVTQPTLSAGIATLEQQMGKRLVLRERRYTGLTAEGEVLLPWAQQILAACSSMKAAVEVGAGALRGELRLGAIPASMPVVGHFADALHAAHPDVSLTIRSLTSRAIEHGLAAFELDAGITYLDHEPPAHALSIPLYAERAVYVVAINAASEIGETVSWGDVTRHPICLLHQGMQNRRILDLHTARRGIALQPLVVADSYVALLSMIRSGAFTTIMPDSYAGLLPPWARVVPFEEPLPANRIGLIVPQRSPPSPLSLVAATVAERLNLPADFPRV